MKPVLGHIEYEEEGDDDFKIKKREPDDRNEGKIPPKQRTTQSVAALKDARRQENITKQEQHWLELTKKFWSQCKCRRTYKDDGYLNRDVYK